MTNLFKYYGKKRITIVVILFVIFALINLLSININHSYYFYDNTMTMRNLSLDFGPYSIPFYISLSLIVIYEFKFKMSKRSLDQIYSFPITRKKLYLTKLILGFVEVLIPFTIAFFISVIILNFSDQYYNMKYLYLYYPCIVLAGLMYYCFMAFIFTRQNSVIDGIINMIISLFILTFPLYIVYSFIYHYIAPFNNVNDLEYAILYIGQCLYSISPGIIINNYFEYSLANQYARFEYYKIISLVFNGAIGIASGVGTVLMSANDKSENAMQKSDSYFGYKVFIPLISITGILGISLFNNIFTLIILSFLIIVGTYLGYVIYLRSFKLNKHNWRVCGIVVGVDLLLIISFIIVELI